MEKNFNEIPFDEQTELIARFAKAYCFSLAVVTTVFMEQNPLCEKYLHWSLDPHAYNELRPLLHSTQERFNYKTKIKTV